MPFLRRRSKFNNRKVMLQGVTFDSKAEAAHYLRLKALLEEGRIAELEIHPRFELHLNGYRICRYHADFSFVAVSTGQRIVQDVKGYRTAVYRLKKRLFRAIYGFDIQEIGIHGEILA